MTSVKGDSKCALDSCRRPSSRDSSYCWIHKFAEIKERKEEAREAERVGMERMERRWRKSAGKAAKREAKAAKAERAHGEMEDDKNRPAPSSYHIPRCSICGVRPVQARVSGVRHRYGDVCMSCDDDEC